MQGAMTQRVNGARSLPHRSRNAHTKFPPGLASQIIGQAVSTVFQVPLSELQARTRRRARIAFARQVAMYLAHVACGLTLTQVGALFGRDRTTVAYACGIVEDRRDDPIFDVFLDHLEMSIVRLASARESLRA